MTQWPILGRDDLLDRAVRKLRGGQSLVVRGEAGIGKTGLARATADRLRRDGINVGWTAATCATRSVPFGALASYLAGHLGDPSEDPGTGLLRLFLRASEGLAAYGAFVVDDAHLLDDGSAALVHQLVVGGRLPMVLTVRSGEQVSDAVERLGRDGYGEVIDLAPLELDAVRAVLEGAVGGPVELLTAERLRRWSGGNPLLLRELVLAGRESGRLGPVAGTWRWAGEPSTASGVRDLVRDRFLGVDDADLAVLRLTALAEPVEANVVARIAGVTRVDGLCRRGLLAEDRRSDRVLLGLPHPLHSEVLPWTCPPSPPGSCGAVSPRPWRTPVRTIRRPGCAWSRCGWTWVRPSPTRNCSPRPGPRRGSSTPASRSGSPAPCPTSHRRKLSPWRPH